MLSFLGFEIVIVATLHPGRYSLMSHLTVACSSLANVSYGRARLGSSLPWLEPRRADQGVLFDVSIVLQSNGSGVSAVDVPKRKCETFNGALHLNAIRAVGQTIISLLAGGSNKHSEFQIVAPLQYAQLPSKTSTSTARFRRQLPSGPSATTNVPSSSLRIRLWPSVHNPWKPFISPQMQCNASCRCSDSSSEWLPR